MIKKAKQFLPLIALSLLTFQHSSAQPGFVQLSNEHEQLYAPWINKVACESHTSVRPWLNKDVTACTPVDSLLTSPLPQTKFMGTWVGRKLFKEHFLQVAKDDYMLYIDPALEISGGNDQEYSKQFFTNSRGFSAGGYIGKRFSFRTSFYENQSTFPHYLDSVVRRTRIVPGQGRIKNLGERADYAFASGTINYELNKHFTFQFGHDKNFIGDGYRSLLLSDYAFNYPYFKIMVDVWKFRYQTVFAVMQDLENDNPSDDDRFRQKYATFHYLDLNIGKHASVGIFEAVVWHSDSLGNRGFDLGYMNPFIFLRPVEFAIGSPDNVLMGLNAKVKINSSNLLYGQLMLDEFLIKEVRAGNGWWANKQGFQLGFKSFNVAGVKNLHVQGEYNYVRPYTYQHRESLGNYGHYRAPLAHPLGANFYEAVGIIRYSYKGFELLLKANYEVVGYDSAGTNYGQNIFLSYNTRSQEYNNEVGQGRKAKIVWMNAQLDYVLNPVTRMSVFIDASMRGINFSGESTSTMLLQAGIRTRLFNKYYDF